MGWGGSRDEHKGSLTKVHKVERIVERGGLGTVDWVQNVPLVFRLFL